ncbi:nucleotidyl transferase AbiEii/AbiGii toxin family protein [Candidatus Micrarchaeota archaeon]|nr:nucleotidyl transferase AbiEii/AbiGii toxin family protein [Candidatus Micrarchaeota archaeon]
MVQIPESVLVESGLSKEFVRKEIKMNDLLAQWPALCARNKTDYALFGGTALNKAYLDQPRFSEDADFFIYGKTAKEADGIIRQLDGFESKGPARIFREMYRWTLRYEEEGVSGTLQLDVNLNFNRPKTAAETRRLASFLNRYGFVVFAPRISVLPAETLLAMKLLALHDREEGKDYYDAYRLLNQASFSKSGVLSEAHKYSASLFDFSRFDENLIEQVAERVRKADDAVMNRYDSFILKPHRLDWRALKKDLVRLLKTKIK